MTTQPESFDYECDGYAVRGSIVRAHRSTWQRIAAPGSQLTGEARVEIAHQGREARKLRNQPPWMRDSLPDAGGRLSDEAVDAARMIAVNAQNIDAEWAADKIESLGEAAYVELGSIVATMAAIDAFNEALGRPHEPLPDPIPGEPTGDILETPSDIGAFVRMVDPADDPFKGPNVGRALSLVPAANQMFMTNVMNMYSSPNGTFWDMEWPGGPIDRPQAELLAARVSAVNECFY